MKARIGSVLAVCIVLAALVQVGCGAISKEAASEARAQVVDCTVAAAASTIDEFTPTVAQIVAKARDGQGRIDWAYIKETFRTFGKTSGACVVANLIANAMSGLRQLTPVQFDSMEAWAMFNELRREVWDGALYKVEAGML